MRRRGSSPDFSHDRLEKLVASLRFVAINMRSDGARRIAANDARGVRKTGLEFSNSHLGEVCKHARAFMKSLPALPADQFEQASKDASAFASLLSGGCGRKMKVSRDRNRDDSESAGAEA